MLLKFKIAQGPPIRMTETTPRVSQQTAFTTQQTTVTTQQTTVTTQQATHTVEETTRNQNIIEQSCVYKNQQYARGRKYC